jgi:hypothetical protein
LKKTKSTARRLVYLAGFGLFAAASGLAPASHAQAVRPGCPAGGFDICFPNLGAGAPNAACNATEEDAADITACLRRVCRNAATEPEPGFFGYCCAQGGSVRYDDFCVLAVQSECTAVADHCVDRCPPVRLLTGTVTLGPPPAACFDAYPAFIANVCDNDPFCCSTSWDSICAEEALSAGKAFAASQVVPASPAL